MRLLIDTVLYFEATGKNRHPFDNAGTRFDPGNYPEITTGTMRDKSAMGCVMAGAVPVARLAAIVARNGEFFFGVRNSWRSAGHEANISISCSGGFCPLAGSSRFRMGAQVLHALAGH